MSNALKNAVAIPRDIAVGTINRAKLFEFRGRQACAAKAHGRPLPGASGHAFTSGPIKAGGLTVARVTPAHWAVLQSLESPLIGMVESVKEAETGADGTKKTSMQWAQKDQWNACYIFTQDIEALYCIMEEKGGKEIAKMARREFGMNPDVAASVNVIMAAILEQMKRHVETMVHFAAELEGSKEISFFQEQPESN